MVLPELLGWSGARDGLDQESESNEGTHDFLPEWRQARSLRAGPVGVGNDMGHDDRPTFHPEGGKLGVAAGLRPPGTRRRLVMGWRSGADWPSEPPPRHTAGMVLNDFHSRVP
jgi:hypothetical protein